MNNYAKHRPSGAVGSGSDRSQNVLYLRTIS